MGGVHHLEHGAQLSLGEVLQHPCIHQTHPEDLLHNTCTKYSVHTSTYIYSEAEAETDDKKKWGCQLIVHEHVLQATHRN